MRIGALLDIFDVLPGTGGVIRPFVFGPIAAYGAVVNYRQGAEDAEWARRGGGEVPYGLTEHLFWTILLSLVALVCAKKIRFMMTLDSRDPDDVRGMPIWARAESLEDLKRMLWRALIMFGLVLLACFLAAQYWAERMMTGPS